MIETISLCSTCYKKIPAFIENRNGQAWLIKECDVHGKTSALVDPEWSHVSNYYHHGSMGRNNAIIIHIEESCNMKCPWCYYVPGSEIKRTAEFYHQLLFETYKGFSLMLSGGEPTQREDYFEFVHKLNRMGWDPSTITNMINLGDPGFFARTLNDDFISGGNKYRFAMSFHNPKNYSKDVLKAKMAALDNIAKNNLVANCVTFSITSLDELEDVKTFYDNTKDLYQMIRIRTMFNNWGNAGEQTIYPSDLNKAFLSVFGDYMPVTSTISEQSNIYCQYFQNKEGRQMSIACSPNVDNLDYHICSRPVFMLGQDLRCYPVPIAQIVAEGISKGWKDGFNIKVEV